MNEIKKMHQTVHSNMTNKDYKCKNTEYFLNL